jgi:phage-related protein
MAANNYGLQLVSTSSDRVDLSTSFTIADLSTFTFEAWVKVGSGSTSIYQRAFAMRQGNSKKGIRLALTPVEGKLRFEFARVDGTSDTNYTYEYDWDDYWHHVAFTADIGAKEYAIILDGAQVQTGVIPDGGLDGEDAALKISNTTSAGIWLGSFSENGSTFPYYWDGKIDNIRLWSSVKSASALASAMNDHIEDPATESGLIDEYTFNEGTGTSSPSEKNSWTATLKRAGSASSALWNIDRPFMGDGETDAVPPTDNTMSAPTDITSDGFTLNWTDTTDDVYVQYFEVTVATDSEFSSPVSGYSALDVGKVLTYDIEDLSPSTNYYARVRAVDAAGNASTYATYNSNAAITTLAEGDTEAPVAPVVTSATSITDASFVANWDAATDNVGVTGYKIDIGLDEDFTEFLGGFRNLDVGSVLTKAVNLGVLSSTVYYIRVRAYDAAENESTDSNTVTVTTSDPPDTEKPSINVLETATSIGSQSFTANWSEGVDNVGVTGYLLDVATDDEFTTYVTGYENLDVGNVTSYGITDLTPQVGYYYRVRAYDAAGNISNDTSSPEHVTTVPSTIEEGGTLEVAYDAAEDTYVDENATATNFGSELTLGVRAGASLIQKSYLKFDLSEVTGTIVNANLRLYVSEASTDTISVQLATGTWDESTLTDTNDALVLTGDILTFTGSAVGWVELDIASMLSGAAEYTVALFSAGTDLLQIDSTESENIPHLVLEIDPTSSTEVQTITLEATTTSLTNLIKNPSAETGGTAFGGATGIDALGAATLLQDLTYAYEGTYSAKVVSTAVSGDGVKFSSPTGLAVAATGQTLKGLVHLKTNTADLSLTLKLKALYTDASSDETTLAVQLSSSGWARFDLSLVVDSGKTVDSVEAHVYQDDAAIKTYWADAVAVVFSEGEIAYFDGDTSPETDWDSIADAGTSTMIVYEIDGTVTYVGDGDEDNTVVVSHKPDSEDDWLDLDDIVVTTNRSTKQMTATVGSIYRANELHNPSFTNDTSWWVVNQLSTIERITTDGMEDAGDVDLACLRIVGDGSLQWEGTMLAQWVPAAQGDEWTFTCYLKSISGPTLITLELREVDAADTLLEQHSADVTITTDWARYTNSVTLTNAATEFIYVVIYHGDAVAYEMYMDRAQLESHAAATPYIDGTQDNALWEGNEHESATYRVLKPETIYDVEFEITDPDGTAGTNPISDQVTTPAVPDDYVTTESLSLTAETDRIHVIAQYAGDENESGTGYIEWKRNDLSTWSKIVTTIDRDNKTLSGTVTNLKPGTAYDVRAQFSDSDDGVYGTNPLTDSVTTEFEESTAGTRERIMFGGFVLSGEEDGDFWVEEHDAFSHPERRTQVEDLPRTDGAVELSDWWGKRVIRLTGGIKATSRSDLYANVAALRRALAPRQQRLVVDTLAHYNYYFNATCTSLVIVENGGENYTHISYIAEFTCADPFRYEASETSEVDIELQTTDEVTINNDGDLVTDAVYIISTTSASEISLTLFNETTGERITPDGTITQSDDLVIDGTRLTVTKNGVEIDFAGGFPRLNAGANVLSVILSADSINLTVRRRHRYL